MGTLAIVEVPVSETVLTETVRQLSDVHFRVERAVATGVGNSVSIWVSGTDGAELTAAFESDETVSGFTHVTKEDGAALYDVTFSSGITSVRRLICEHDGVVQEAYTEGTVWTYHLRFPSRKHLSRTKKAFDANGIEMEVVRIHDIEGTSQSAIGLTESQRTALETALEAGYYEVPRRVGLQDLAEELGESHQSLSEKLRRAHGTVVSATVTRTYSPHSKD